MNRGRPALALAAVVLLAACATARREAWALRGSEVREPPAQRLDRIASYPQALATALHVMRHELGLPALAVDLLFLPDAAAVEAVLLKIGHRPQLARRSARTLVALGGHRIVLVNQSRLEAERGWPDRVALLAHELAHVLQYELGGGIRGTSSQWLREGFAGWAETRVVAALGGEEAARAREKALMRVRAHARLDLFTPRRRLAPLSALRTFPEWVERSAEDPGAVLSDYAFLAAQQLVEERGLPAMLRYFELFATRQNPAANFQEAFGEPEEDFDRRLRRLLSP